MLVLEVVREYTVDGAVHSISLVGDIPFIQVIHQATLVARECFRHPSQTLNIVLIVLCIK